MNVQCCISEEKRNWRQQIQPPSNAWKYVRSEEDSDRPSVSQPPGFGSAWSSLIQLSDLFAGFQLSKRDDEVSGTTWLHPLFLLVLRSRLGLKSSYTWEKYHKMDREGVCAAKHWKYHNVYTCTLEDMKRTTAVCTVSRLATVVITIWDIVGLRWGHTWSTAQW